MKVGFIGAGRMGSALMHGLLKSGRVSRSSLIAFDSDSAKVRALKKAGIRVASCNRDVVSMSDVIFIAVKPKDVSSVLHEVSCVSENRLFVSIAAGVKTSTLEKKIRGRVVRVMPNTPCIFYHGVSAFTLGRSASRKDGFLVKRLLSALGVAVELDERLFDVVTGLSGSGPAYVYLVIKALADAGFELGIDRKTSLLLAVQTVRGAAELMLKSGKSPEDLIADVCSPGGTTVEGLKVLERGKVADSFRKAVKAAAKRSKELG